MGTLCPKRQLLVAWPLYPVAKGLLYQRNKSSPQLLTSRFIKVALAGLKCRDAELTKSFGMTYPKLIVMVRPWCSSPHPCLDGYYSRDRLGAHPTNGCDIQQCLSWITTRNQEGQGQGHMVL